MSSLAKINGAFYILNNLWKKMLEIKREKLKKWETETPTYTRGVPVFRESEQNFASKNRWKIIERTKKKE